MNEEGEKVNESEITSLKKANKMGRRGEEKKEGMKEKKEERKRKIRKNHGKKVVR